MIQATKIVLTRAEGPTSECRTITLEGEHIFERADSQLFRWGYSAPGKGGKRGGYDKCDFMVYFADGQTYDGRFDLVHPDLETPNLQKHIIEFLGCFGGVWRPSHMSQEDYDRLVNICDKRAASVEGMQRKHCCKWLTTYQIGDDYPRYVELRQKAAEALA